MAAVTVGQDKGVLPLRVLEIIMDAFLLHQPANEVEIGLPILDTIFPLRITDRQRVFDVSDPTLL